ncbi:MAG: hypothetical protein JNJ70_10030 [Verrucomicrobiales bacterium]|nr:hypothetical protein [Verrucomicrobiales bacterium]
MNPFHQPEVPATAKVLSLVRLHHGLPSASGEEIPHAGAKGRKRLERVWKSEARLNHLFARRRCIALEEIPSGCFPVILELSGGSNFVILRERTEETVGADSYLVQFPDSREALVRGDRLRELYDGVCVFLRPGSSPTRSGGPGLWKRLRERLAAKSSKKVIALSFVANLLNLAAAIAVIVAPRSALGENVGSPFFLTALGVIMAAAVTGGLALLRHPAGRESLQGALVDCAFIPFLAVAIIYLAGWGALPFLVVAGIFSLALLASRHLGSASSAFRRLRPHLLTFTFLLGASVTAILALAGQLTPAFVAAGLVLGTTLVDRLFDGDLVLRELRLLACL